MNPPSVVTPEVKVECKPFQSNVLSQEDIIAVRDMFQSALNKIYRGDYDLKELAKWAKADRVYAAVFYHMRQGHVASAIKDLVLASIIGVKLSDGCVNQVEGEGQRDLATALGLNPDTQWKDAIVAVSSTVSRRQVLERSMAKIANAIGREDAATCDEVVNAIARLKDRDNTNRRKMEEIAEHLGFVTEEVRAKDILAAINDLKGQALPAAGVFDNQVSVDLSHVSEEGIAKIRKAVTASARKTLSPPALSALYGFPPPTPPLGESAVKAYRDIAAAADRNLRNLRNLHAEPRYVVNESIDLTMVADDSGIPQALFAFKNEKDRDDYLPLLRTFLGALEQAAYGKGRERHANDLPFIEQPILAMAQMLDSDAGLAQQVIKKTIEARTLPTKAARINELRGALVYAAAMILFEEMHGPADEPSELEDLEDNMRGL